MTDPTKKTRRTTEYSVEVNLRSFSMPPDLAFPMLA